MSAQINTSSLFACTLLLIAGCDASPPPVEESDPEEIEIIESDVIITTPAESASDRASGFIVTDNADEDATTDDSSKEAGSEATDADSVVTMEKADVGAGKKGRGYGGGLISEPAKQYFSIREKTVFQIQIPHALKLYKALNGKQPKDHDTFMESIIKENNISLPELPDGKSYVYDADEGELMIQSGGENTDQ